MHDKIIREIVFLIFEKAKEENTSHSMYTLCSFLEIEIGPSYKTFKRAHDKYIDKKGNIGPTSRKNIDAFCNYLGYKGGYSEFKEKYLKNHDLDENSLDFKTQGKKQDELTSSLLKKNKKKASNNEHKALFDRHMFILLTLVGAIMAIIFTLISRPDRKKCMMWSDDHFVEIDCNSRVEINSGNTIQNYDNSIFKNLRKIEVTINTPFFKPKTKEPRVWYTMNQDDEIEYFSAPGKHPITGMKLVPINDSIIDEYVINKKPSVLNPSVKNGSNTKDIAVLIFHNQKLDYEIATKLQNGPLKGYKVTPYLIIASKLDQELKNELLTGNLNTLGKGLSKHVDELCIGTITYSYRESGNDIKRYTCEISLNYDVFLADGSRQTQGAFSKQVRSIGFSKDQAKQNALRELTE